MVKFLDTSSDQPGFRNVSVLPAAPRRQNFGQNLSNALGGVLEAYGQHQNQQQYAKALQGIGELYKNPQMSDQQRLIESYRQLGKFAGTPEAKELLGGLSKVGETPLQKAQRLKIEHEIGQTQGDDDFLSQLMGGNQRQKPSDMRADEMEMESDEGISQGKRSRQTKQEFDYQNPETWTDQQINKLRSIEGKTAKSKTLSRMAENEFARRKEEKTTVKKYEENVSPLQGAMDTLSQMEKIGAKGRLGIGTKVRGVVSPKTRKDAAEYERLGKSLISFASNIPIRNRQEFEVLAHDLYDPSISDDARAGILFAMKRIIQNSIQAQAVPESLREKSKSSPTTAAATRERPPLQSFMR